MQRNLINGFIIIIRKTGNITNVIVRNNKMRKQLTPFIGVIILGILHSRRFCVIVIIIEIV
jgi:hypothetical protein